MASTGTDNPTPLLGQPDLLSGPKTKTKKNVATDSGVASIGTANPNNPPPMLGHPDLSVAGSKINAKKVVESEVTWYGAIFGILVVILIVGTVVAYVFYKRSNEKKGPASKKTAKPGKLKSAASSTFLEYGIKRVKEIAAGKKSSTVATTAASSVAINIPTDESKVGTTSATSTRASTPAPSTRATSRSTRARTKSTRGTTPAAAASTTSAASNPEATTISVSIIPSRGTSKPVTVVETTDASVVKDSQARSKAPTTEKPASEAAPTTADTAKSAPSATATGNVTVNASTASYESLERGRSTGMNSEWNSTKGMHSMMGSQPYLMSEASPDLTLTEYSSPSGAWAASSDRGEYVDSLNLSQSNRSRGASARDRSRVQNLTSNNNKRKVDSITTSQEPDLFGSRTDFIDSEYRYIAKQISAILKKRRAKKRARAQEQKEMTHRDKHERRKRKNHSRADVTDSSTNRRESDRWNTNPTREYNVSDTRMWDQGFESNGYHRSENMRGNTGYIYPPYSNPDFTVSRGYSRKRERESGFHSNVPVPSSFSYAPQHVYNQSDYFSPPPQSRSYIPHRQHYLPQGHFRGPLVHPGPDPPRYDFPSVHRNSRPPPYIPPPSKLQNAARMEAFDDERGFERRSYDMKRAERGVRANSSYSNNAEICGLYR